MACTSAEFSLILHANMAAVKTAFSNSLCRADTLHSWIKKCVTVDYCESFCKGMFV